MPSNRNNKTYNPELFDRSRQSNEEAAADLFGFVTPAPAPTPETQATKEAVQEQPVSNQSAEPVYEAKTETPVMPAVEPEAVRQPAPSVPLSQRNIGGSIMGDDPVVAPSASPTNTTAEKPAEPVMATATEEEDPMLQMASGKIEQASTPSEPVQEAPKTVYRTPLAGDFTMDGKPSQGIGGMPGIDPYARFAQEQSGQKRVVPNPAMGSETFGYGQPAQEEVSYNYETLLKPQTNYKTFGQKTISVHSPKGGAGKSTVAKELAWAFALGEVNGQKLKVLLVDVDWEFGDQAMLFNVDPNPNMSTWAKRMRQDINATGRIPRYDKMTIKSFVLPITENLDLLAASKSPLDEKLITVDMVKAIVANLKSSDYDVVIYDNTNTIKDPRTYIVLDASDHIFLIDTLDMTTISEIAEMLTTLRNKSFDLSKISLVINTVPQDIKEQDITPEQVVEAFELNFSTQIPETKKIRMNNNDGTAAMFATKDNDYTRAIKHMANEVLPVYPEKKKGVLGKLFSKN